MKNTNKTHTRQEINQQKACNTALSSNFLCFLIVKLPKVKRRILNALIQCAARGWFNPSQERIARMAYSCRETVNRFLLEAQDIIGLLFMDSGKYTYTTNTYYLLPEFNSSLVKETLQEYLPALMMGYSITSCQSNASKKVTPFKYYIQYTNDNWTNDWINSTNNSNKFHQFTGLDPHGGLQPMILSIFKHPQQENAGENSLTAIDLINPLNRCFLTVETLKEIQ